jgi:hypothetical protein
MSDARRHEIAEVLREELPRAREVTAEAQDVQRFFSVVTIAALRGWGGTRDV